MNSKYTLLSLVFLIAGCQQTVPSTDNSVTSFDKRNVSVVPIAGVEIENTGFSNYLPPPFPSAIRDVYYFGPFWRHHDFNNDGYLDYLYTGTFFPDNENVVGDQKQYACGRNECKGLKPRPSLFINDRNGGYSLTESIFYDERKEPGISLARQNLIGDFNGDGTLDIFVADHGLGTTSGFRDSYYLSQSNGTWIESSKTHLSDPNYKIFDHGGATGDIDGDGDLDIVLTDLKHFDLVCWFNDGKGKLTKKTCAKSVFSFAIELGDIDGDGDLDIVYGGREEDKYNSGRSGVAFNSGGGAFKKGPSFPAVNEMPGVAEVSLWDLDDDGDLDFVISRHGYLYAGTGVQIVRNDDGRFSSQFIPIVEAPVGFIPEAEGNEWNMFINHFLFSDVDGDGDSDIVFVSGHSKTHGGYLRNNGGFDFTYVENISSENPIKILPDTSFYKSSDELDWLDNLSIQKLSTISSESKKLKKPIRFDSINGVLESISKLSIYENGLTYIGHVKVGDDYINIQMCSEYYKKYKFFGSRVGFRSGAGFGGSKILRPLGSNGCIYDDGYAGEWEVDRETTPYRVVGFLSEINLKGKQITKEILNTAAPDRQSKLVEWDL